MLLSSLLSLPSARSQYLQGVWAAHTDWVAFGRLVLLSACISIRICNRLLRVAVEVVGFRFLFLSEQLGFVSCYRTRITDQ